MADVKEEAVPGEEQQKQLDSTSDGPEDTQPAVRSEDTEERPPEVAVTPSIPQHGASSVVSPLNQFRMKRFFVLRPGTLNQAIKDVEALVDKELDGGVRSIWLMAEVDHWNNEKERLVLITNSSLLVCKYDFVMFNCEQIQRIPLNFVDRISHGTFSFPKHSILQRNILKAFFTHALLKISREYQEDCCRDSPDLAAHTSSSQLETIPVRREGGAVGLLRREGEGVRVFWDRLREPSFTSRWNPFTTDLPFITFTYHPVRNISDTFTALCDIQKFREQLRDAAQEVHAVKPVPGKANGVLVLNQNILIDAYVGVMSFLGNQNKLGYCMARGNIGF